MSASSRPSRSSRLPKLPDRTTEIDDAWANERKRVAGTFDGIADLYREGFASELDSKPFDRALLGDLAHRLHHELPEHPVLEVGAGPGHIGGFLRERGVRLIASDASPQQMAQARILDPTLPLVVSDLARLPCGPESLGAVVAFYCLIYGPPDPLDDVLRDWQRALEPNGLALIAVHAGVGSLSVEEWQGRRCELTIELRDPDDLAARLRAQGFVIERQVTRPPYDTEHETDRSYILARRAP